MLSLKKFHQPSDNRWMNYISFAHSQRKNRIHSSIFLSPYFLYHLNCTSIIKLNSKVDFKQNRFTVKFVTDLMREEEHKKKIIVHLIYNRQSIIAHLTRLLFIWNPWRDIWWYPILDIIPCTHMSYFSAIIILSRSDISKREKSSTNWSNLTIV